MTILRGGFRDPPQVEALLARIAFLEQERSDLYGAARTYASWEVRHPASRPAITRIREIEEAIEAIWREIRRIRLEMGVEPPDSTSTRGGANFRRQARKAFQDSDALDP